MPLRKCLWCGGRLEKSRGGYTCTECETFTPLPRTVDGTEYEGR